MLGWPPEGDTMKKPMKKAKMKKMATKPMKPGAMMAMPKAFGKSDGKPKAKG
jgi:hypothetical protein